MKQLSFFVGALLITLSVLAQQPDAGFSQKLKTLPATPGLAKRLNASVTPVPRTDVPGRNSSGIPSLAPSSLATLKDNSLRVVADEATGLPVFIERTASSLATAKAKNAGARLSASVSTYQFMDQIRSVLKLKTPAAESFAVDRSETDELGQTHVRLTQIYRGIPVHGAEMVAHLTDGEVTTLNGRYHTLPDNLSTSPQLTAAQAGQRAFADVGKETTVRTFGQNLFNIKPVEESTLCVYPTETGAKLVWRLLIWSSLHESWTYMIDAQTGEVLNKYSRICSIDGPIKVNAKDIGGTSRSISTYLKGSTYHMMDGSRAMYNSKTSVIPDSPVGGIWTMDLRNTYGDKNTFYYVQSANNTDWDPKAVSSQYNSGLVYEYYLNTHKRNAIDGKGGTIISIINVPDQTTGKPLDNAFWNGKFMCYGNGNTSFKPLVGGLDVAAHEMTHGVVSNSANLEYQGQSGALNESIADIFGCMVDRANWLLGEDVVNKSVYPLGTLRNLSNPNQGGEGTRGYQPKTMSQYDKTDSDNGGVHINSGIPNYAFYLFATDVTKEKAEKVYYRALTNYLTATSQFLDMRLAVIKATGDLYGAAGAEVAAAKKAFDAVGIVDATQTTPTKTDLPTAQGPDLVLVAASSDTRLYSTAVAVTPVKFDLKTATGIRQRPSVTDDGKTAYYVSADKRIRLVNLTGTPTEFVVQNETIWRNVAISRDGNQLAALTDEKDGSIWVYSFPLKKWNQFQLYTPTFSQDTQTDDVQYADSFEWDPTGDYLIFDAYNVLKSATGTNINYWDVSFIRAWNGSTKQFGDGTIRKLFSNLDEGESVGNPSYAKNSRNVIAFDYYNDTDGSYAVLAYDYAKGTLKLVADNTTLGFPNYSRLDDKIVYSTKNGTKDEISAIGVATDKVTPTGKATVLYTGAKWPVWYTQATRALATRTNQIITFDALADRYADATPQTLVATSSAGLPVQFAVTSGPAEIVGNKLTVTGPGKVTVRAYQDGSDQVYAATAVDRTFTVQVVLGVEPAWDTALTIYPNPVGSTLTVEITTGTLIDRLQLTTLTGAVLPLKTPTHTRSATVDMSQLPVGMYFLQVETTKGTVIRKVVRQ